MIPLGVSFAGCIMRYGVFGCSHFVDRTEKEDGQIVDSAS